MKKSQEQDAVNLSGRAHSCGGHFMLVSESVDVPTRGSSVSVHHEFYRCNQCGEERLTIGQASSARKAAVEEVRRREKLLSPAEVRAVRERLGFTQELLERRLGFGPKTVVRWETGRVLQSKATDNLLRLLARDPTAIAFLQSGVDEEASQEVAVADPWVLIASALPKRTVRSIERLAQRERIRPFEYLILSLTEHLTAQDVCAQLEHFRKEVRDLSSSVGEWNVRFSRNAKQGWLEAHKEIYAEQDESYYSRA